MRGFNRRARSWSGFANRAAAPIAVLMLVLGFAIRPDDSRASGVNRADPPSAWAPQSLAHRSSPKLRAALDPPTRWRIFDAVPTPTRSEHMTRWPRRSDRHEWIASPQDRQWSDRFKRPGFDNRVFALGTFDGEIVAGGDFILADSTSVMHVGRWDGSAWQPLGSGVSDGPEQYRVVQAILPYGGELVVGGRFQKAGEQPVHCIARWDGVSWSELGGGMTLSYASTGDVPSVQCLIEFEGDLIAGGLFDRVDGTPSPGLARWNGSSWSPFGSTRIREVYALAIHEGALVAACDFADVEQGSFRGVIRWDGQGWSPVGASFIGPVRALTVYRGDLIAGASFGAPNVGPASHLARWDGTAWQAVGGGILGGNPWYYGVEALAVHDDRLIIGGEFAQAGEVPASCIAAWDGLQWTPLGTGVHLPAFGPAVHAFLVHENAVIVGGDFSRAGEAPADFVARWEGGAWNGMGPPGFGMDGLVTESLVHEGQLLVAGHFQQAGSLSANHVARWDGDAWIPVGQGLPIDSTSVHALAMHAGQLHAAVTIAHLDSTASFIARLDGSEWTQVSSLTDAYIGCMIEYDGDLVVGGWFTRAGDVPASAIARWDGMSWAPLGTGMSGQYHSDVRDLAIYDGELVAAGVFDRAGDVDAANIARWNGVEWLPLSGGLTGQIFRNVYGLALYGDALVAVGEFDQAGDVPVNSIASWDGSKWSAVGDGQRDEWNLPFVVGVAAHGRYLFVSSLLFGAGTTSTADISRWDGTAWTSLGSGLDDIAITLEYLDGGLWAGGWFNAAGNKQSAHIARWSDSSVPVLIRDFLAFEHQGGVVLHWTLSEVTGLVGVDVERASAEFGPWTSIAHAPLAPQSTMSFVDERATVGTTFWYRLRVLTTEGSSFVSTSVVWGARSPSESAIRILAPIVPEDGGPIQIRYELDGPPARVELTIYDLRGRLVRRLERELRSPGEHHSSWDRRTEGGASAPRGVYFVQVKAGNRTASRKLVRGW